MKLDTRLRLFFFLAANFVVALVVGDILGGKLTEVPALGRGWVISVGMIPFPVTFVLTDLLNEFYGKRAARYVTLVGFVMALFAYTTIFVAMAVPWAPFTREPAWDGMRAESFENVFNGSKRILVGSMCAYLVAQLLDIGTFHFLKRLTRGKHLWLRATGSTVVSQLLDTLVITFIAWTGLLPLRTILEMIATSYLVKLVIAICLTPIIYAAHAAVERVLRVAPVSLDDDGEPVET
ncbi:MAG: queuosine precursor transporter [Polyangiaceae bacterium]|nr:queuosine precursor transporter [Polyangiaceae bacterium]